MVCLVRGRPYPHVTWSKDGRPIQLNDHITQTQSAHRHTLTIMGVAKEDFGSYVCVAENNQGKESAVIQLTGQSKNWRPSSLSELTPYQKSLGLTH